MCFWGGSNFRRLGLFRLVTRSSRPLTRPPAPDTPEPAPGSVAAGVTDAEVQQFSAAMVNVRAAAPSDGSTPTPEQAQAMAAAVTGSGLTTERFNEIATAVSQDAHLRARVRLVDAQRAG